MLNNNINKIVILYLNEEISKFLNTNGLEIPLYRLSCKQIPTVSYTNYSNQYNNNKYSLGIVIKFKG